MRDDVPRYSIWRSLSLSRAPDLVTHHAVARLSRPSQAKTDFNVRLLRLNQSGQKYPLLPGRRAASPSQHVFTPQEEQHAHLSATAVHILSFPPPPRKWVKPD